MVKVGIELEKWLDNTFKISEEKQEHLREEIENEQKSEENLKKK